MADGIARVVEVRGRNPWGGHRGGVHPTPASRSGGLGRVVMLGGRFDALDLRHGDLHGVHLLEFVDLSAGGLACHDHDGTDATTWSASVVSTQICSGCC